MGLKRAKCYRAARLRVAYYLEGETAQGTVHMKPISRERAAELVRRYGCRRVRTPFQGSRSKEIELTVRSVGELRSEYERLVVSVIR